LIVGADLRPGRPRISTGCPAPHASSTCRPRASKLRSVLVAPLVEEVYFRGYLLPRMPQRLGSAGSWHMGAVRLLPAADAVADARADPGDHSACLRGGLDTDRRIGIVAHVVLNSVDLVVLVLFIAR
jgi:Type II CAAX prenyl endopeptidase Rce1-like